MKRKRMIAIVAVLILFAVIVPFGKPYELPFSKEEVSSVTMDSDFWRTYKEAETEEDIALVVKRMNRIQILKPYDVTKYAEEGDYSRSIRVTLKDGRVYTYDVMAVDGLGAAFTDETGTAYLVYRFQPEALWNQLEAEEQVIPQE